MTTTVIGATGRVGTLVVRQLAESGHNVRVLVRDDAKAMRLFDPAEVEIRSGDLTDPATLTSTFTGSTTVIAMLGSIGIEGSIQRAAIHAAHHAQIEQLIRLSVFNASPTSLGINQRAHWSIDTTAEQIGLPFSTVRPAIFSASLLAGANEIRSTGQWTGLAEHGRIGLVHHADAADAIVRITEDRQLWDTHHDITGPELYSWPEALGVIATELGRKLEFITTQPFELIQRLINLGFPAGLTELLVAREWATLAGENERLAPESTNRVLGREPRGLAEFVRDHRAAFSS